MIGLQQQSRSGAAQPDSPTFFATPPRLPLCAGIFPEIFIFFLFLGKNTIIFQIRGKNMTQTTVNGNWVVDFRNSSCWHSTAEIVISFEAIDKNLTGKIKHIPVKLIKKCIHDPQGKQYLRKMIQEAEEAFSRVYFQNAALCYD